MRSILSKIFFIFLFCGVLSGLGCDAGKPKEVYVPPEPPEVAAPAQVEPKPEPERELIKAEPNASGKADFDRGADKNIMAPILVPLGQYFRVQDRIALDQVKHAMNLFKAGNNNKGPATHEEFMDKIIKANNLKLPQLRNADDHYQYDPETEELMISTVKK